MPIFPVEFMTQVSKSAKGRANTLGSYEDISDLNNNVALWIYYVESYDLIFLVSFCIEVFPFHCFYYYPNSLNGKFQQQTIHEFQIVHWFEELV